MSQCEKIIATLRSRRLGFDSTQCKMRLCEGLIGAVLLSALLVAGALAQGAAGNLSGTVTDANGAAVAGATVTLTSTALAFTRQTSTDASGAFAFQLLPPGDYRIEVAARGFKTVVVAPVVVRVTETTALDVRLEPALNPETVTVSAAPPLVQRESSQIGRVIDERPIRQLPLPTRNFQQLLALSPGAYASVANNTELGRGDATIVVNGQRTTSNNVRINGVDANSIGTNSTPNIAVPATDSLQEFIVQTSLYDASQGRNAGGNVEAVTRSGGNEFHGNLYYFFRNRALNANDFFLNAAGQPRPVLTRNQFGGTLGGRLIRDRLFFFGSYQGTRERNGASLSNSLMFPTIPVGLRDDNRTAAGLAAAFGVPAAAISPIALALLQAKFPDGRYVIPSPTTASGLTPISSISRFSEDQMNANFDLVLSSKHTFSAKNFFATNPTRQANYNFAGLGNGPTQLPGFGGQFDIIQTLIALTDTYVINSNTVNQARFGFSRIRVTSVPDEPFTARQFGINNPLGSIFPGMPTITVTGLFTLGSSPFADQSSRINAFTLHDTISFVAGRHRLRIGGEYRRSQVNFYFNAFSRGQLIFPTFANFLLGQSISIIGSGVFDRALRTNDFYAFVQDDWKVNERLTLNLGLRYDFFGLPYDIRGRLVNFLPDQFRVGSPPNGFVQAENATAPLPGVPLVSRSLAPNDWNNFAPRVGFAYQLDQRGRLVLRGGYGIYYDRFSTRYANTQLLDYPYLTLATAIFRPLSDPFFPVPAPSAFPLTPTVPSPLGAPISGIYVAPDLRTPYVQQYSLNLQWEFARDLLLEVGYVGSKGTKLLQVVTLNQPVYVRASNQFIIPLSPLLSTQKNVAGGIQQVQTSSNSHYDSLQASVTKRLSAGLQFLAAYTFGKSIDYYSGSAVNELAAVPGDQLNWRANRGPSDFDRTHRFVASFVYDLPRAATDSQLARTLLNGWQVAGIVVFQSGTPFSVVDAPNNFIIQRANIAPGFSGPITGSGDVRQRLNAYFNTAAFVISRPNLNPNINTGAPNNPFFDPNAPFGNTGRNFLRGPGQRNVDFSAIKRFPLRERTDLEFRAEFFNLFNWANFANPNSNVAVPQTFGRITATASGPRVIQFALKLNF